MEIEQLQAKVKDLEGQNALLMQRAMKAEATAKALRPVEHKQTKTNYVFAFEIEGEKFYKWNRVEDIPLSRKIYIDGFMQSTSMVMTTEHQRDYWHKVVELANAKDFKNLRLLGFEALKRIELLTLPSIIFRVMAMLYLKETDNMEFDIPAPEIERRAQLFEKKKLQVLQEIFLPPMSVLLSVRELMKLDSQKSSKEQEKEKLQIIQSLLAQQFLADYTLKHLAE